MKKIMLLIGLLVAIGLSYCAAIVLFCGASAQPDSAFSPADSQFYSIDVASLTEAPLVAIAYARLNARPELVFKKVSDHENMMDWVSIINQRVEVDHSTSITPGTSNIGSSRRCRVGAALLVEDVVAWLPGKAYAYSQRQNPGEIDLGHLAVVIIERTEDGGSLVSWRQYIKPIGFREQYVWPAMMKFTMNKSLLNLAEEYGGAIL